MPLPFSYPLLDDSQGGPSGPATPTTSRPYATRVGRDFLGFGLVRPFRRDLTGDLVAASDVDLVKACVEQVLGTRASNDAGTNQGELPWRPRFGSLLHVLRFRNNDALMQRYAQLYVADALKRWEPRVVLRSVLAEVGDASGQKGNVLYIRLRYDILDGNTAANQVVVSNVDQTISFQRAAA